MEGSFSTKWGSASSLETEADLGKICGKGSKIGDKKVSQVILVAFIFYFLYETGS